MNLGAERAVAFHALVRNSSSLVNPRILPECLSSTRRVMIVFMAVIVGTIVIALFLPIIRIIQLMT